LLVVNYNNENENATKKTVLVNYDQWSLYEDIVYGQNQ